MSDWEKVRADVERAAAIIGPIVPDVASALLGPQAGEVARAVIETTDAVVDRLEPVHHNVSMLRDETKAELAANIRGHEAVQRAHAARLSALKAHVASERAAADMRATENKRNRTR